MAKIQCGYTWSDPLDGGADRCADAAEFIADPDDSRLYLCGRHLLIVLDQPGERYLIEVLALEDEQP